MRSQGSLRLYGKRPMATYTCTSGCCLRNRRAAEPASSGGSLSAMLDGILQPRQRQQKQGGQEVSEEQVDPEQSQVETAKPEPDPKSSQRSMRFHDSPGVRDDQVAQKYAPAPAEEPVGWARIS